MTSRERCGVAEVEVGLLQGWFERDVIVVKYGGAWVRELR